MTEKDSYVVLDALRFNNTLQSWLMRGLGGSLARPGETADVVIPRILGLYL